MIYLNNRLVPPSEAMISVFDHGFLYGDGIYETLRAYEGTVFFIDEHIDRLFRSASMTGLSIRKTEKEIKKAVYKTLEANRLKEAVVRISISRGAGPTGLDPDLCKKPTFVIMANRFREYPGGYYQKGIKIMIAETRRNYHKALDPKIKSLNFLNNILAKIEAKDKQAYEAIMLNYRGHLAEGTISNVFFVRDGLLCTPSTAVGILDGITRRIILETARGLKIKTREGRFRPGDIYKADEVFISNTTMEVMPVAQVDTFKIKSAPGPMSRKLLEAYREEVSQYTDRNKAGIRR